MKVFFHTQLTGATLAARFRAAIGEEGVGFDPDFDSAARLEEGADGTLLWITARGGYRYELLNPSDEEGPALLEYEGPHRGFLAQNLLPEEVGNLGDYCIVTEGSVVESHGIFAGEGGYTARTLVEAYGLLQDAPRASWPQAVLLVKESDLLNQKLVAAGYKARRYSCNFAWPTGEGVILSLVVAGAQVKTCFTDATRAMEWVERVGHLADPLAGHE